MHSASLYMHLVVPESRHKAELHLLPCTAKTVYGLRSHQSRDLLLPKVMVFISSDWPAALSMQVLGMSTACVDVI